MASALIWWSTVYCGMSGCSEDRKILTKQQRQSFLTCLGLIVFITVTMLVVLSGSFQEGTVDVTSTPQEVGINPTDQPSPLPTEEPQLPTSTSTLTNTPTLTATLTATHTATSTATVTATPSAPPTATRTLTPKDGQRITITSTLSRTVPPGTDAKYRFVWREYHTDGFLIINMQADAGYTIHSVRVPCSIYGEVRPSAEVIYERPCPTPTATP